MHIYGLQKLLHTFNACSSLFMQSITLDSAALMPLLPYGLAR